MIAKTNRAADIIKAAVFQLSEYYDKSEALSIIRLLMEERFGVTRLILAEDPARLLTESQIVQVHKDLRKLKDGIPVQYVLGYSCFLGVKLAVGPEVLIPRPETEELSLTALKLIADIREPFVLDIGTGSGAIAIALKIKHPDAKVFATDFSQDALAIARRNAQSHEADITFLKHDILDGTAPFRHPFDIIISNPPYIPTSEESAMADHVKKQEPYSALFVDDHDPLIFFRAIGETGKHCLREGGFLLFETHHLYAEKLALLLKDPLGYQNVEIIKDIHGKDRIIIATKGATR